MDAFRCLGFDFRGSLSYPRLDSIWFCRDFLLPQKYHPPKEPRSRELFRGFWGTWPVRLKRQDSGWFYCLHRGSFFCSFSQPKPKTRLFLAGSILLMAYLGTGTIPSFFGRSRSEECPFYLSWFFGLIWSQMHLKSLPLWEPFVSSDKAPIKSRSSQLEARRSAQSNPLNRGK